MSKTMVLTLGHNASAIVVQNGHIIGGYEEERFSNIKSDSAFPNQSIERLMYHFGKHYDDVCVGHWFTSGMISANKYINYPVLESLSGGRIHSIQPGITHHDSHLLSAKVFAEHYNFPKSYMAIVADGFGTFGECITLYDCDHQGHRIINRFFGYGKSLGMLYQYTTAYLGMKMHNHEYKLLGYEAHIREALTDTEIEFMNSIIFSDSSTWVKSLMKEDIDRDTDPVVNKAALAATQHEVANRLDSILEQLEKTQCSLEDKRIIIAYYVQGIVESVVSSLVDLYKPKNLLVSGGLFYNVKLNSLLADRVQKFCVMPLAGDQGAGLGVYHAIHGDLKWPGHLAWGHRSLHNTEGDRIVTFDSDNDDYYSRIANQLQCDGMINIVRGSMEFGPRSLCNTATIAIPTMRMVNCINEMNDRTTVMPMAPAMTREQVSRMLKDSHKIYGSLEYMVATRQIQPEYVELLEGAAHHYPINDTWTCRPQIVSQDDTLMSKLLNDFGPLINTSFNFHGVPIAFEKESIEFSHQKQNEKRNITTFVIM